jgi:hypothetical protein
MAHDPIQTQKYIDDALRKFTSYTDPVERNVRAFAYLRGMRRRGDEPLLKKYSITVPDDPGAPFDESLADAEHYMYARFLTSSTGDPSVRTLVTGLQDARTNPKYPVLPPSSESMRWGYKGVDDGLADYKGQHGGSTGTLGSAIVANRSWITGGAY